MTFQPTRLRLWMLLLVAVVATVSTPFSYAQSFAENTLYPLTDSDGASPSNVVEGADGNYYGIATFGGLSADATPGIVCNQGPEGCGTIFEVTAAGVYSVLYTFQGASDGAFPLAILQGGDGSLYGVAAFGGNIPTGHICETEHCTGYGTIFRLTTAGQFSLLYAFNDASDGSYPVSLIPASDGNFYGTTYSNTLFRISPPGDFTPLSTFNQISGMYPTGLVQSSDGNLYGTTQEAGSNSCAGFGCGTIYKSSLSGAVSPIYAFLGDQADTEKKKGPRAQIFIRQPGGRMGMCPPYCTPGIFPNVVTSSLSEAVDGSLYGTTSAVTIILDGQGDSTVVPSTVFKVSPSNNFSNLYTFNGSSDGGGSDQSLALASDGNFYGTSGSTVFQVTPGGSFATVYTTLSSSSGTGFGALLQGSDGLIYGESSAGGNATLCKGAGCGTIFTLAASPVIAPPIQLTFPSSTATVASGVNLTWAVSNAFSLSTQQCYAFVQGGAVGAGNWTGLQPGTLVNGVFTGSQTIVPTAPGTYTYALTCGGYESGFATLTVAPLSIITSALPIGVVGQTYSAQLSTISGLGPYTWTITSGALPPGLSLGSATGVISGVPAQVGTATFTVQVFDSEATPVAASATFSLTVDLTAVTLSATNLAFSMANAAQTVTLTNVGNVPVLINSISTTGNFVQTNNCGVNVAAVASCAIAVSFTPSESGSASGYLVIVFNSGSAQTVALSGTQTSLQFVPITPCRIADTRNAAGPFGGPAIGPLQTRDFSILQSACGLPTTAAAYALNVTVVPGGSLGYLTVWPAGSMQPVVSLLNSVDGRVKANAAIIPAGAAGAVSVYAQSRSSTDVVIDVSGYFAPATGSSLEFYPLTPCRIADTRNAVGPLGGPSLAGGQSRAFPVQSSACQVPASAQAYSLNITAIPSHHLSYLTIWPTGQAQPAVSTLNAVTGTVVANAAIVPAGSSGQVSVFVTDDSDVAMDVNGYFAPPSTGGTSLYATGSCRMLDTRELAETPFPGSYSLSLPSNPCSLPSSTSALVLNATVVPQVSLEYITLWPAGETQPVVSTLNALDGSVTSNMAIVPVNSSAIEAYATDGTQLILDGSSYFAP